MSPHKTITVNGRVYDAVTGLPLEGGAPVASVKSKPTSNKSSSVAKPRAAHPATQVHGSSVQRSQTLNRRAAKKPASLTKQPNLRPAAGRHMDIAKHAQVSRFAPHPVIAPEKEKAKPSVKPTIKPANQDRPTPKHPTVERALAKVAAKKPAAKPAVTAKQVKDAEIAKAIAQPKAKKTKQNPFKRLSKKARTALVIVGIIIALAVIVGGIYKFFPSVSVRIAASQAGISASYPEFTPDGYSLSQPVTYKEGEVDLKFTSNSNDNYYTISQSRNSWDSSAVLDNIVTPSAGANYSITKERGLTIYMYDSSAAWVNGGILYKIESKAALSGDQIRRIATSL